MMVDFVCPILSILLIACDSAEISSDGSSKITWLAHVKLSPAPALFNGNSKQLSWRGALVIELDDQDPKVNMDRIDRAVAEIWAQFPPQ